MNALYYTNTLGFLQYQLTKTTVCGQTYRPTQTHYPDSEPNSLCSFSLMLHAQWRNNKYQFYSLIYPIGVQTHNLPHPRRAPKPLHHRCGITTDRNRFHNISGNKHHWTSLAQIECKYHNEAVQQIQHIYYWFLRRFTNIH